METLIAVITLTIIRIAIPAFLLMSIGEFINRMERKLNVEKYY
jgi:hypothetical protein